MKTEIPVFKRCCLCLPLRRGVLAWAYLKQTILIFLVYPTFFFLYWSIYYIAINHRYTSNWTSALLAFVIFLLLLMTMASNVLVIVAAHKKNSRLMRMSLISEVVSVSSISLFGMSIIIKFAIDMAPYLTMWYFFWDWFMINCLLFISCIGIQLYIISLIRSEVIKLEGQHEFRFVNNAAEGECQYYEKTITPFTATESKDQNDNTSEAGESIGDVDDQNDESLADNTSHESLETLAVENPIMIV